VPSPDRADTVRLCGKIDLQVTWFTGGVVQAAPLVRKIPLTMPKSFYIIDGHAQIYRAYFAPFRDLTSPTGEPTRATFVFTQMLMNLVENRKPDYLAMVIDDASETALFRKEILPEYKANRKAREPDFNPQEERILQIVRDAGVPIFVKPGFEADDVIATMAKKLCDRGEDLEIFLVTKDKDLRQMLNGCTKMFDVASGEVMDPAAMEAKLGYTPAEAIDVQTLMGDATDNVPGIPGVGEKTAVKFVKKYGSAEAVMNHLDDLTPKMRENFEKFGHQMPITRQLVTLRQDLDIEFDPENCKYTGLNVDGLRRHLNELGFTQLLRRLGDSAAPIPTPPRASAGLLPRFSESLFGSEPAPPMPRKPVRRNETGSVPVSTDSRGFAETGTDPVFDAPPCETGVDCKYHLIATEDQFEQFLTGLKQQKRFAFDTETDDLGAMRSNLIGMSFAWEKSIGYYVPVRGPEGQVHLPIDRVLTAIKPILEDVTVAKVGHNIKYDLLVMRNLGVEVRGVALDSMIAAFLLDASRMQYGIDRLALDLLNFRKIPTTDLLGKGKHQISMQKVDLTRVAAYASEDADITLRLADLCDRELNKTETIRKLADDLETPLIDVLAEMEFNGIAIDQPALKEQSIILGQRLNELRAQIVREAGGEFNLDSPKQLADVLFGWLKLKTGKKTTTGYSTDVNVLEKLAPLHPVPRLMLEYRQLTKLKNTYVDNLPEYVNPRTHRIHPSFSPIGAETGRLSCSDPNLQNIPIRSDEGRRIRLAFVPGDPVNNVLLAADYSQIELRVLAHITQEPALLKAFANDEDIHQAVASEVFGVPLDQVTRDQRGHAKTINFGIVYGVTAFGLSSRIEGLTTKAAQELINAYNARFPGIDKFNRDAVQKAQDQGYVETILGRRRPILEINSAIIAQRRGAERAAGNTIIQGSAADLMKTAMVKLHRRMQKEKMRSKLLLQVHDELVFETPIEVADAEAEIIREEMVNAMQLSVPLKVEVGRGKNWQDAK
jgi:DNA polymerase-1